MLILLVIYNNVSRLLISLLSRRVLTHSRWTLNSNHIRVANYCLEEVCIVCVSELNLGNWDWMSWYHRAKAVIQQSQWRFIPKDNYRQDQMSQISWDRKAKWHHN